MTNPTETERYARGRKLGEDWIKSGGNLDADGPDTNDEEFYNGFIDALSNERRRLAHET
jgi:hypothetical protein